MRAKELVQPIIGARGFVLEEITHHTEMNEIILSLRPTKREQCRCGICRRKAKAYDKGHGRRRWRCLDVGAQKVYVEAESPRVRCPKPFFEFAKPDFSIRPLMAENLRKMAKFYIWY